MNYILNLYPIVNFIVVFLFNILWISHFGTRAYARIYNGKNSVSISVLAWVYAFWGLGNLVCFFIRI